MRKLRQIRADGINLRQVGGIGDNHFRPGIFQPVSQPVFAKQCKKRHHNAARLIGRQMHQQRLGRLRQQDRDPRTVRHARRRQDIGKFVRQPRQLAKAVGPRDAVGLWMDKCGPIRFRRCPIVANCPGNIELCKVGPLEFCPHGIPVGGSFDKRFHGSAIHIQFDQVGHRRAQFRQRRQRNLRPAPGWPVFRDQCDHQPLACAL